MSVRILQGDALDVLKDLPDQSVHCIVTSPPYWGLRDYKIEPSIWDSDPDCRHRWRKPQKPHKPGQVKDGKAVHSEVATGQRAERGQFCRCGAWRGTLGLEPSPELFVEHLVMIFAECWRVLRDDGTLWVNIGDSSASGKGTCNNPGGGPMSRLSAHQQRKEDGAHPLDRMNVSDLRAAGLKPGDLVGIPWRFALAMQAAGWTLRQDNCWAKKSPMPESVSGWSWQRHQIKVKSGERAKKGTRKAEGDIRKPHGAAKAKDANGSSVFTGQAQWKDCPGCPKCEANDGWILRKGSWRHTRAHEYIFMFSKGMGYYCDGEAVKEAGSESPRAKEGVAGESAVDRKARGKENYMGTNGTRNPRSVWTLRQDCYQGPHYAAFPQDLPRKVIQASTSEKGVCPECGSPWTRMIEKPKGTPEPARGWDREAHKRMGEKRDSLRAAGGDHDNPFPAAKTVGWKPSCDCNAGDPVPATVLDCFGGTGTTAMAAEELHRDSILIEIAAHYIPLIKERTAQRSLFTSRDTE